MKYEVPTRFVFSGTFIVEAENPTQAKELIQKQCYMGNRGNIQSTLSNEDIDWDFNIHPETITGRVKKSRKEIDE